jgi:eukaryotic-like serine/threonine-protein kinase
MRDLPPGHGSLAATPPNDLEDPEGDLTENLGSPPGGSAASAAPPAWEAADRGASRYRLLGPLGIGGMGVVYRALDTQLGRTVALKFLPPALAPDAQAKARFLEEARAVAALDHPNICTLFEVGETADGQLYLAIACYEGETLKTRLGRGPVSVSEALQITVQVASGLARAHRLGIVHRDIKPANLMLTSDGMVKILDFGIAQLPGRVPVRPLPGTPAYMSPEQARGEEVDARSDLWSLGVVLYEMLYGRKPGDAGSRAATTPLVLPPAGSLQPDTPPELSRLLSRMLAVDPGDRHPDTTALLADLARLAGAATASGAALSRAVPRPRRLAVALSVVAAVAVGLGAWWLDQGSRWHRSAPIPPRATYLRLTDLPGREGFPSLSPDGRYFLYAKAIDDRSHVFLQRVGGSNPLDLSREAGGDSTQPAFSPDGRQIAFRSERDGGGIFVMGATGESVRRLTDFGFNPAWSPDGREIVCDTASISEPSVRRQPSELYRVSLATGERRRVRGRDAAQPSWSPHGYRIAYWGVAGSQRIVWTVAADGGQPTQVTDGRGLDWNPVWSPDGSALYFASDRSGVMNLWRVPIDERSGRVLGEPEPVTVSSRASMQFGVARNGNQFIFAAADVRTKIEKIAFEPASGATAGATVTIAETSQRVTACDASHDGHWLAFQTMMPKEEIWVVHPDSSGLRQLVGEGFRNRLPRWSPDTSRIAFYSNRGGPYEIWTVRADGSQLTPATAFRARGIYHPIWSPDGSQLACDLGEQEALVDLGLPLGERRPQFLPPAGPRLGFTASSWSPDGRWLSGIVHRPDEVRLPGIVLYSVREGRYLRLTERGEAPTWLSDSRHLLYVDDREIHLLDAQTRRAQRVLTAPPGSVYEDLSLSPDDRLLYLVRVMNDGDIWLLSQE